MALKDVIIGYAKGDKGDKGDTGERGATGQTGPQGEPGNIADAAITDTQGLDVAKGEKTTAQKLFDAIADRIVNKLVTNDTLTTKLADYLLKSAMSSTNIDSTTNVPTSALVYSLMQDVNNNLSNSRKTVRIPTNITTGTNILKLDPGFYAHEDNKASNQDKLNMGLPVAAWHSHIHVFGSWANAEKTNGYLTFIVEDMGDKTAGKIYYRALSWESWSPWKVISMTDFSSAT